MAADTESHPKRISLYVKDIVYAASDGIITMFAIVAGATGASLQTPIILVIGLATLLADGVSMGVADYLGTQSEIEYTRRQREMEAAEVDNIPQVERQEIRRIFSEKGLSPELAEEVTGIVTSDNGLWVDIMMAYELGLRELKRGSQLAAGLSSLAAFIAAGFMPLLFFILSLRFELGNTLALSVAATLVSLFSVGAARVVVTGRNWVVSGLEMMAAGGAAAVIAYFIGSLLNSLLVAS